MSPASLPETFLRPFSLHDVRLLKGSQYERAQQTNLEYLLYLDVDRLVWSFRATAGLATPSAPYGGWEDPKGELRGHFVGHYLSASALMYAGTGNTTLHAKMQYLVRALAECQDHMGTGYLSAFPTEEFDRVEALQPVWAPYYTIHKIMAGLLDQYTVAGDALALAVVVRMADYFKARVDDVITRFTINRHWDSLNEESGGMNDVLYNLYHVTGKESHLELAHLFDKPCFLGPLTMEADELSGFHSNTHIPLVVGAQARYELLGDDAYRAMSKTFMDQVHHTHMYSTGGTSGWEFWQDPHRLGDTLQQENQETCTTYNMIKVARNLFRYSRAANYTDFIERATENGIIGTQRGTQPGVMIYMTPLGAGVSKARGWHGWGTPEQAFWCCYGSGVELFSKLGENLYFQGPESSANSPPSLFVAQFQSSTLHWQEAGLIVHQTTLHPTAEDAFLSVTLEIQSHDTSRKRHVSGGFAAPGDESEGELSDGVEATINVRIPAWAAADGLAASVNGDSVAVPSPGHFLEVTRFWESNDTVNLTIPVATYTERIQDDRPQFANLSAVLSGPYLLAGSTKGDRLLAPGLNANQPSDWIRPVEAARRAQLRSISLLTSPVPSGNAENDLAFVSHVGGRAFLVPTPNEGTDEAAAATFRFAPPLADTSKRGPPSDDQYVSLELFDTPGQFLVHNGAGHAVFVADRERSVAQGPAFDDFATFKQVPGLAGPGTVSFEALSGPGQYLSAFGSVLVPGQGLPVTLQPRQPDPAFAAASSFHVGTGLAAYHPMSFIAKGQHRDFLLFPIQAYRDESYTAYFDHV
ncbi:hypothetical protein KFL_003070020 [Klebsormidium nitens]|uniref:Uncharacterized protein n=1 Tax=Klebsormidium nitens TaxID=105231 RepID=A0A1Y1I6Y6_KLENI|nr:hypothetical protein KFL_003070020 [Klebsormidium nitens]|eukprot:GAQ86714.1 hypothetical protein KFL_003070020 [Klebsormidium nitens]